MLRTETAAIVQADLGVRINEHHRQAYGHAGQAIEHARLAGELLLEAEEMT